MFTKKVIIFSVLLTLAASKSVDESTKRVSTSSILPKFVEQVKIASNNYLFLQQLSGTNVSTAKLVTYEILDNSIDQKCAEEKFAKFDLIEKWNNFTSRVYDLDDDEDNQLSRMYLGIIGVCSSKIQPMLEFIFDATMSFRHIVKAFMNEPLLGRFFFYLRCANNYAIENKVWNNDSHPISTLNGPQEFEICEKLTTTIQSKIDEVIMGGWLTESSSEQCINKNINSRIKIILRLFLLAQVELTEESKRNEKENFIKSINQHGEQFLYCLSPAEEETHPLD